MTRDLDGGFRKPNPQAPRRSTRIQLSGRVQLRRSGYQHYSVKILDLSREGCRVEFVTRPRLDETVYVKLEGLEVLPATVCWTEEFAAGVEFQRPIHAAVFELLVNRAKEGGGQRGSD